MKQWLQSIGILKEDEIIDNQPIPASQGYHVTSEVGQFLYKAKRHYCEECDRFFEKVQGAVTHIRIKHGK